MSRNYHVHGRAQASAPGKACKHATHLATNARLLENVHGLWHDGTLHAQALRYGLNAAVKCAPSERGVLNVQGVAQFVEGALFWHHNLALVVDGAGLEEIADLGAGEVGG